MSPTRFLCASEHLRIESDAWTPITTILNFLVVLVGWMSDICWRSPRGPLGWLLTHNGLTHSNQGKLKKYSLNRQPSSLESNALPTGLCIHNWQ